MHRLPLRKQREWLVRKSHDWRKALHVAEGRTMAKFATACHLSYYALVAIEAHGNYRWVAALLILVLILEGGEE